MAMGLASAFLGAIIGITQSNPKAVLAYSSISQMGFMTVGLEAVLLGPAAAPGAAAAVTGYALHHGLAKGALFLSVGVSPEATSKAQRRWLGAGVLLPALSLVGAPLTSGAAAKKALKASLAGAPAPWPDWLAWLLPLAAVGTALLMAPFLVLLLPAPAEHSPSPRRRTLWVSWIALLAAVAAAGWLLPAEASSLRGLWSSSWPVLAGALGAWLLWRPLPDGAPRPRPEIPAGDIVVWVERLFAAARRRRPAEALAALSWVLRLGPSAEARLRSWPAAGVLLVLVGAAMLAALAR